MADDEENKAKEFGGGDLTGAIMNGLFDDIQPSVSDSAETSVASSGRNIYNMTAILLLRGYEKEVSEASITELEQKLRSLDPEAFMKIALYMHNYEEYEYASNTELYHRINDLLITGPETDQTLLQPILDRLTTYSMETADQTVLNSDALASIQTVMGFNQ